MNSRLLYLENKNIASTSSTHNPGQLPGKAVQNPKDFANVSAITLRSGTVLRSLAQDTSITEDSEIDPWLQINEC